MRQVYLDYSATTPVKEEVLGEMLPWFSEHFGNPSSLYSIAQNSKDAINKARQRLSELIHGDPQEITFTSCGTEANNWAVFGVCDFLQEKGKHIITSKIEHHAVLHPCEFLEQHGYDVTYLDVDKEGKVHPADLEAAITDKTVLISIMFINNEVGTVLPIRELAAVAKKHNILFHTDAVQALGNVPIDVKELGVDLMSMSAHKVYGPKGIGALYIRKGVKLSNFLHGGGQENKKRAGTENVAGIVGFGKAAELANFNLTEHVTHTSRLRDYFIDQVLNQIEHVRVNGSMECRHPGNANLTFDYIEGESILLHLDIAGISASTGSACTSASLVPSHVLAAMGVPDELIHGTLRFTVGDMTTKEDIDYVVSTLSTIVKKLREISSVSDEKGW